MNRDRQVNDKNGEKSLTANVSQTPEEYCVIYRYL